MTDNPGCSCRNQNSGSVWVHFTQRTLYTVHCTVVYSFFPQLFWVANGPAEFCGALITMFSRFLRIKRRATEPARIPINQKAPLPVARPAPRILTEPTLLPASSIAYGPGVWRTTMHETVVAAICNTCPMSIGQALKYPAWSFFEISVICASARWTS